MTQTYLFQPPFPKQPQPAPGIAAQMDPTPDHGEESYVGSGKLKGRKALITGGGTPANIPITSLNKGTATALQLYRCNAAGNGVEPEPAARRAM